MPTKAKSKKDRKKRKEEELEEAQRELEKLNDGEDDDLVPMHDTKKIMEEHEPKSNKAKTKMSKKDKKVIINTWDFLTNDKLSIIHYCCFEILFYVCSIAEKETSVK